jgi:hypothetical protein
LGCWKISADNITMVIWQRYYLNLYLKVREVRNTKQDIWPSGNKELLFSNEFIYRCGFNINSSFYKLE